MPLLCWGSSTDPGPPPRATLGAEISQLEKYIERGETRSIPVGSVWTLNISPDSAYGENCGFDYDTFALVTTAQKFSEWKLRVVNLEIKL